MKALVCERPGELTIADRPEPTPEAGDIVVRIRRIGVCGTDFHIFAGKHPYLAYPRVMGHELAGEVVSAPPGSALRPGLTVYVVPYLACHRCRACRRGLTNACRRLSVLGVHQDGGMAEFLAIPEGNVVSAEGISLDDAAMVEFLAIGAHGVRRACVCADDRVLVIGAGPIGLAAITAAAMRGAQVTALDLRPDRLDTSRRLGASAACLPSGDLAPEFQAATDGDMFDVVIDATGSARSIASGLDFLGHGGRHVLLSVVRDDLVFPDPEFHKRETTLLASRNAQPEDFATVVDAIRAGRIPTAALRTHRAPLTEAPSHFKQWLRPETGVIKAILDV